MRSGAQTLVLLATHLNSLVLRALSDGPRQLVDLRREAGHPPQTTLRTQLKRLVDAGVIEKRRRNRFPGVLGYELTDAGRDLLPVIEALERWLTRAPGGPLALGESAAKAAVKALADGWSTAMLRALAAKPLTLTELDGLISSINYPSLERRLSAMRLASIVEPREGNGRGTPHGVTKWARRGIAPLIAAMLWERCHAAAETAPVTKVDVEATLLLATGLLKPPTDLDGSCRLVVELRNGKGRHFAGVLIEIRDGQVTSLTTRLEGHPNAWVSGPVTAWFAAMIERDEANLELGGDGRLARDLVASLHDALFALPVA